MKKRKNKLARILANNNETLEDHRIRIQEEIDKQIAIMELQAKEAVIVFGEPV